MPVLVAMHTDRNRIAVVVIATQTVGQNGGMSATGARPS